MLNSRLISAYLHFWWNKNLSLSNIIPSEFLWIKAHCTALWCSVLPVELSHYRIHIFEIESRVSTFLLWPSLPFFFFSLNLSYHPFLCFSSDQSLMVVVAVVLSRVRQTLPSQSRTRRSWALMTTSRRTPMTTAGVGRFPYCFTLQIIDSWIMILLLGHWHKTYSLS